MAEEMKQWTEDQIVAAFASLHNEDSGTDPKQAAGILRSYLEEIGEGPYETKDIYAVSFKLVAPHCAEKVAMMVVGNLVVT